MQNYKILCAAVAIYAILVNTRADIQTDRYRWHLDQLIWTLNSLVCWAKNKQPMRCEAQLAWKCLLTHTLVEGHQNLINFRCTMAGIRIKLHQFLNKSFLFLCVDRQNTQTDRQDWLQYNASPAWPVLRLTTADILNVKRCLSHQHYSRNTMHHSTMTVVCCSDYSSLCCGCYLTNNVTGCHRRLMWKLPAGYRVTSLQRTSHVVMRFHRQAWYHALSLHYACTWSPGIILTP